MIVDVNKLSHQQLSDLIKHAESRKRSLDKEKIAKIRHRILALLEADGVSFEDLFGGAKPGRRTRRKALAKYRNPADPSQTWSGRGKHPRWFDAALKAGKKEKELLA